MNDDDLLPLEQIDQISERYVWLIIRCLRESSPAMACEAAELADQLARLHEEEADHYRTCARQLRDSR